MSFSIKNAWNAPKPGVFSKVPEITIFFWILKILTTGMGEVASDFLVRVFSPSVAIIFGTFGLIIALVLQFRTSRYKPWAYWFTVVIVSVFGTMAADVMHVGLGVPYSVSTIGFMVILVIIFIAWQRSEKTLSIHSIYTSRREAYYWCVVLTTFALGTATGDMTAVTFHLGYLVSGLVFVGVMLAPLLAYFVFGINEILAFWVAYIITRPLGASFADWMGVSTARGGLNLGTGQVSLVLTLIIVGLVWYITATRKDIIAKKDMLH